MTHPDPNSDKRALRSRLRGIRAAIPDAIRKSAGRHLVRYALRKRLLRQRRRIGFYIPAKGEIDVMPLLNQARQMRVDCYLPIVPGRGRKKLWFSRLGDHQAWRLNRYGIPEYHHPSAKWVRANRLDMVFIPLLGFDRRGFRIGMGGGYYDASLAFLGQRLVWRKPRLIGVAFAAQQVVEVPRDPWDIPVIGILTEQGYRPSGPG